MEDKNEVIFSTESQSEAIFFIQLTNVFPCLNQKVLHPKTNEYEYLHNIIIDLNDCDNWSRERIADWLETLSLDISRSDKYGSIDSTRIRPNEAGT